MNKWSKRVEIEPKFPSFNKTLEASCDGDLRIISVPFYKLVSHQPVEETYITIIFLQYMDQ
jgi:hypothetical protein